MPRRHHLRSKDPDPRRGYIVPPHCHLDQINVPTIIITTNFLPTDIHRFPGPYFAYQPLTTITMAWKAVLPTLLLLLPGSVHSLTLLKVPRDALTDFTGRAQIHVLNSTDLIKASPTNTIGCLDERGMLISPSSFPKGCAMFTRADLAPNTLSTSAGPCSFRDQTTPMNRDSIYGRNTHSVSME